ncbi:MAG: helix-turn-helix domain-containing protein [Gemmatimonadaceae bacterium]
MSFALDPYILDTLMADLVGHDRQPSAFLVYLALTRRAFGAHRARVTIALQDLVEATGLSKRTVQTALAHLVYRRCLAVERASLTATPTYTVLRPWRRGS